MYLFAVSNYLKAMILFKQVFISIASFLVGTAYGMSTGHSAVLLPHLRVENGSLYIEEETGSWIGKLKIISIIYTGQHDFLHKMSK